MKTFIALLVILTLSGCGIFNKQSVREAKCSTTDSPDKVSITCDVPKAVAQE